MLEKIARVPCEVTGAYEIKDTRVPCEVTRKLQASPIYIFMFLISVTYVV